MLLALADAPPETWSAFLKAFFLWKSGLPIVLLGVAVLVAVALAFRRPKRTAAGDADATDAGAALDDVLLGKSSVDKRKRSETFLAVKDATKQIGRLTALAEEQDRRLQERDAAIERLRQQVERGEQQRDTDGRVDAVRHAGEQMLASHDAAKRLLENVLTALPSLESALRRYQEDMEVAVHEHRKAILADRALDSLIRVKRPVILPAATPAETATEQSLPEEHPGAVASETPESVGG